MAFKKLVKESSVESDAERLYVDARKSDGKITVDEEVRDFGVLARLSKGDDKIIVIAGIHQYGTWIVAEFLNKVIRGESDDKFFNAAFDGGNDFVIIIHGNFLWCKIRG